MILSVLKVLFGWLESVVKSCERNDENRFRFQADSRVRSWIQIFQLVPKTDIFSVLTFIRDFEDLNPITLFSTFLFRHNFFR